MRFNSEAPELTNQQKLQIRSIANNYPWVDKAVATPIIYIHDPAQNPLVQIFSEEEIELLYKDLEQIFPDIDSVREKIAVITKGAMLRNRSERAEPLQISIPVNYSWLSKMIFEELDKQKESRDR